MRSVRRLQQWSPAEKVKTSRKMFFFLCFFLTSIVAGHEEWNSLCLQRRGRKEMPFSVRPTAKLSSARTALIFCSSGARKEGKAPQNKWPMKKNMVLETRRVIMDKRDWLRWGGAAARPKVWFTEKLINCCTTTRQKKGKTTTTKKQPKVINSYK